MVWFASRSGRWLHPYFFVETGQSHALFSRCSIRRFTISKESLPAHREEGRAIASSPSLLPSPLPVSPLTDPTSLPFLFQLAGTLNRFFTSHSSIHLITIPRSIPRIEQTLKFDLASNGDKFGHLYEGLDLAEEVTEHKVVKKDAEGVWQLGDLVY